MSNALRTKYLPDDPGRIPSIATRTRKKPSTTTTERIKLHRHTKWEDALSLEYADPSTIEYSYRTGSVKESSNPTAEINGNSVNLTSNLGLPCQPDCSSTTNESIDVPNFVRDKPESYCRFCCSTGNLLSIFPTGEVPNERLLNLLRKLVDIDLTVELDFPSAICKVCVSKLENFDVFRLKCRAYNDEIRKRRVQPSIDVRNRNFSNTEDQIELPVIVKEELMIEDDFYEDSSNNNALLKPTVIEKKATAQLKLNSVEIDMNVYSGENVAPSAAISEELNVDSRVTSKKLAVKEETPNNPISSEQSPWDKSDLTPLLKKPAVAATPSSASKFGKIVEDISSQHKGEYSVIEDDLLMEDERTFRGYNSAIEPENVAFASIEEVSDSHQEGDVDSPARRIKRKHAEPVRWKKNVRKRNRAAGKSYINTRGVSVPAKKIQIDYHCGCRNRCSYKISFEQRLANFKQFYENGSWAMQTAFIAESTRVSMVDRRRAVDPDNWKKHYSRRYYLQAGDVSIAVCKPMFMNTLCIDSSRIHRALQKASSGCFEDRRGKHPPTTAKSSRT